MILVVNGVSSLALLAMFDAYNMTDISNDTNLFDQDCFSIVYALLFDQLQTPVVYTDSHGRAPEFFTGPRPNWRKIEAESRDWRWGSWGIVESLGI